MIRRPNAVSLSGVLRQSTSGEVSGGYYDIRVVAFDAVNGEKVIEQDYEDVEVDSNGEYSLSVDIPRFAPTGEKVFQICHSAEASLLKDGLESALLPEGCKEPVEQGEVFKRAECPQQLFINITGGLLSNVLGSRTAAIDGGCTYEVSYPELAPTDSALPSIMNVKGDAGQQGLRGSRVKRVIRASLE